MLENQFIQWDIRDNWGACGVALPAYSTVTFLIAANDEAQNFDIVTPSGVLNVQSVQMTTVGNYKLVQITLPAMERGTCFRIRKFAMTTEALEMNKVVIQGVCDYGDEIWYKDETKIWPKGIYRLTFDNQMNIRGQRSIFPETNDVSGWVDVRAKDPTPKLLATIPFEHGVMQNPEAIITLDEPTWIQIWGSVGSIGGYVPDCAHFDLYANTDEYPPVMKAYSNVKYSNTLIMVGADYGSVLDYRCYEPAFGFPVLGQEYNHVLLPIRLHSPQFEQEDKTYVKADGEVVTLYAKYYKEWEGETEYLPEAIHDKIVAALSCDEVYIDDRRVTKTDKYQIDWENSDTACDGITKLAKATFKVREHVTQRNSNY